MTEFRKMSEFDPSKPALVHDGLNDKIFEWKPEEYLANYRQYASQHKPGVIEWDGLLLDGWRELTDAHTAR